MHCMTRPQERILHQWQVNQDPSNDHMQVCGRGLAITVAASGWPPPLPAIRAAREAVRANLHTETRVFLCVHSGMRNYRKIEV